MRRMITIVNLGTGAVSARPSDTQTLDLPRDFDPEATAAALDGHLHALYRSTRGKEVSCTVHPRPLSWRVHGEECLVADEGGGVPAGEPALYSLCAIEPGAQ